eukprot:scaffold5019_cov60-Phaeocystis_antarctica.AAC.3
MGQSMLLSLSEEEPKHTPSKYTRSGCCSIWSTASSASPESSPILAHIGLLGQGATHRRRALSTEQWCCLNASMRTGRRMPMTR